jgi:aspartyl/asparaginyl-tRNA synthetase
MTVRPKEGETPTTEGSGPSKNALKKAQKEKEKADKSEKRMQQEQAEREEREKAAEANDTSKHLYGPLPANPPPPRGQFLASLQQVEEVAESSRITLVATVQSARKQGGTLAFLVLGKYKQTIQAVVTAGGEQAISKQMVKWCQAINTESIIRITAQVRTPAVGIQSESITLKRYELHVEEIFMVDEAPEQLPIQVKNCNQPPPTEEEGEEAEGPKLGGKEKEKDNINVSLKARLNNRVLALRAPSAQAIMQIQGAVVMLFQEFMANNNFTPIQPSYIAGAATEGGAGVFEITYFQTKAYLTQSPQFFKQMAIAGGLGRVSLVGPVFRAENSNTKRHLCEVCSFYW